MIDIKIDGNSVRVQHHGDPVEIAVEMSIATNMIYTAFEGVSTVAAKVFQHAITGCLTPDAPTWKTNPGQVTLTTPTKKSDAPPVKVRAPQIKR